MEECRFGLSKDLEKTFWTVQDIGWVGKNESSVSINFRKQKYIRINALTRAQLPDFSSTAFTTRYVKMLFSYS